MDKPGSFSQLLREEQTMNMNTIFSTLIASIGILVVSLMSSSSATAATLGCVRDKPCIVGFFTPDNGMGLNVGQFTIADLKRSRYNNKYFVVNGAGRIQVRPNVSTMKLIQKIADVTGIEYWDVVYPPTERVNVPADVAAEVRQYLRRNR